MAIFEKRRTYLLGHEAPVAGVKLGELQSARSLFKLIYKVGMILVTLMLIIGAVAAYWVATPANQLLLISGILAILALISGLSITKLDWQDKQAETYRQLGQDIRNLVRVSTRHSYAEPEVYHVDAAMLDTAKRMASDGASIDDICKAIDPGHDGHDPAHKEAFRKVVEAMIDQG
ncbi:MAG: hypothetical protein ABIP91_00805 [Sphingomicrobium sp.]